MVFFFLALLGILYGILVLFIPYKIALMVMLGIPLVVLILLKPMAGFVLLIFSISLTVFSTISSSFLGIFTIMTVTKVLGGLTLLSVLIRNAVEKRRIGFFRYPQTAVFLLLLAVVAFSGFSQPCSFTRECFTKYASFLMLFYLTLSLVNSPKRFRIVLWSCVSAMAIAASYGIAAYLKGDVTVLKETIRAGGVWNAPNYFAISLLLVISFSIHRIWGEKGKWGKLFGIITTIILLTGLVLTFSRAGMVGFVALLLVLALKSKRFFRGFSPASLIGVTIIILLVAVLMPKDFWKRVEQVNVELEEKKTYTSVYRRVLLTKAGWNMILDRPIRGVGLGNFYWSVRKYSPVPIHAGLSHNMYIGLAAELGLIGFFLFMSLIYLTMRDLRRIMKSGSSEEFRWRDSCNFASSLYVGLVGFLMAAVFLHAEYEKFFWLAIFLTMALRGRDEGRPRASLAGTKDVVNYGGDDEEIFNHNIGSYAVDILRRSSGANLF